MTKQRKPLQATTLLRYINRAEPATGRRILIAGKKFVCVGSATKDTAVFLEDVDGVSTGDGINPGELIFLPKKEFKMYYGKGQVYDQTDVDECTTAGFVALSRETAGTFLFQFDRF